MNISPGPLSIYRLMSYPVHELEMRMRRRRDGDRDEGRGRVDDYSPIPLQGNDVPELVTFHLKVK